jgi:cytochrome b561
VGSRRACTSLILVTLHVLAALQHHFIDRDTVLRRMIPALRTIFHEMGCN